MSKVFSTLILIWFLFSIPVMVFSHTVDDPFVTDLIAGGGNAKSAIRVGDVKVWNTVDDVYVKYEVTVPGWCITETHLEVTTSLDGIPQVNGNPVPGNFTYKSVSTGCVTEHTEAIDLGNWTPGTELFVAAHANLRNLSTLKGATAWGAGLGFPGKNWATYFTYTVQQPTGKDLTVSKAATGTFDRTYLWTISKNVDHTQRNIAEGGTATFNYSVSVQQTGISDSGWIVNGTITVSNPNPFDVAGVDVLDVVDNGGTCTVTGGGGATIPASGSQTFSYTCSYASTPSSYSGTNTATATWDSSSYFTPNGSASGAASFALSQSGSSNKTVHVTDSYGGTLGTVTATDFAPFANGTFTYARDEVGVAGTCTSYDNTAKITETGQTASTTVTTCVGKDLTVSKTASLNGSTLSGTITVGNPNDWENITLTSLSDAVNIGGTCTLAAGPPYVVPKSSSLAVNYSCSGISGSGGTNTATAIWDYDAYFTPSGSASGSKTF